MDTKSHLEKLFAFLRIPSISTLPEHGEDVRRAADFVAAELKASGFQEENITMLGIETPGHPVVFAERIDDPTNPTILIYGHYDVQPPDPIEQWVSPPFEPTVRDGSIFARGATDDKGQLYTHIAALKECAREWGSAWPVNVKLLIEGEEESGGEMITALLSDPANKARFAADVCIVSDSAFVAEDQPAIECALRGIVYLQVDVRLADADMHSGLFGGAVMNPALALAHILASLKDPVNGRILIPGIYEGVPKLTVSERRDLHAVGQSDEGFLASAGNAKATHGEMGYTTMERTTVRPSLDVNGMWAGFTGTGAKTIIPASAHAKVSIRTVGDQDPLRIAALFEAHVSSIAPREVDVAVTLIHCGDGMCIPNDSPFIRIASAAIEEVFEMPPVRTRSGGSIPAVALIQKHLGIEPLLIGYGLPDDGLHSPNEKFSLEQFEKGIACNRRLYESIARMQGR